MDLLIESFRTGMGVQWADYGADIREGQPAQNRAAFARSLGTDQLPAIPEVNARLRANLPARVADIASGAG